MEKDEHDNGPFVRLFAESKPLSRDALEILSASRRAGTEKRYNPYIKRLAKFCRQRYTDSIQTTTEMGIEFLTGYFKTGVGYSSVSSARSALSSVIKQDVMSHLENQLWYADVSKRFLILGQSCQDMLQRRMLAKFLLLSSQIQLLQSVI